MAKLIEMGQITTLGIEGERADYKMALLIEFDSVADIRKAIAEGRCEFGFGDPDWDCEDPQSGCHDCGEDTCVCA